MALKRSGLGKGLDAIFIENDIEEQENIKTVRISKIEPNRKISKKIKKYENFSCILKSYLVK